MIKTKHDKGCFFDFFFFLLMLQPASGPYHCVPPSLRGQGGRFAAGAALNQEKEIMC